MNHEMPAYGLWGLVVINSAVFLIFAFSFSHPRTKRDWRSFGAFSAFIVALFTEMYGFPLTIYLLSGWLSRHYPGTDVLSHNSGHLWHTLFRMKGDAHSDPLHILSNIAIFGGFILLSAAWNVLYKAQRERKLAVDGPYAHLRHPQYLAFITIMVGFLLQWPTVLTLVMFPILVWMYVRLAHKEECDAALEFGPTYARYAELVPAFVPRLHSALPELAEAQGSPNKLRKAANQ